MDAFPAAGEPYRTNLFLRYCQEFADKGCIEGFGSAFSRSSPNPNAEAFDGKKRYKCVLCTTRMYKDLPLEARGISNPSNSGYSSMKTTLTHIFNCHPEIPWGWKLNLLGKEFEKMSQCGRFFNSYLYTTRSGTLPLSKPFQSHYWKGAQPLLF